MQQMDCMLAKRDFEERLTMRIPVNENWESGSVINGEEIDGGSSTNNETETGVLEAEIMVIATICAVS